MAKEKILNYSRSAVGAYDGVAQQRPWDCGPASAQIILQACGVLKDEQYLIDRIGTNMNGTNHAGLIAPILNELLPGSGYNAVWLSKEPVTKAQIDTLWKNIVRSVDAGRGVILNFEAPPGAGPQGSRGSVSPPYPRFSTTYHYTAGMGYAIDDDGSRHVWVADPACFGGISGYWCRVEEIARLIVPHAYAFAADAPVLAEKKNEPVPPPVVQPDFAALNARVDKLSTALATLLAILERQHPDTLRAYLDATKG